MFFVAVTKRVNCNSERTLSDAGNFRIFIFIQDRIEATLTVLHYASLHAGLSTQPAISLSRIPTLFRHRLDLVWILLILSESKSLYSRFIDGLLRCCRLSTLSSQMITV
jgi:hypothetical protein